MGNKYLVRVSLFITLIFISSKGFSQNPSVGGQWSDIIPFEIVPVAVANLPDGRLITWSSKGRNSFFGEDGFTYTQIFDPFSGTIGTALPSKATDTDHDMFCPGVNNLPDGRILSAGGLSSERTSIYDYVTDTWQRADDMNIPRGYQGNVTTADGGVFTIGGSWSGGLGGKDAEIWYPETGWLQIPGVTADLLVEGNDPILDEPNPGQTQYRSDNHVWLWSAPNGKIFHAGPGTDMHWIDIDDLGNATVQNVGSRLNDTYSMKGTTVMYDVGKLLKVGGARTYSSGTPANDRTYTIDINQNIPAVSAVPGFQRARTMHNSTVLPNGKVLVTGGLSTAEVFSDTGARLVGEVFDPVTNTWSDTAPMKVARTYHSVAILMADGRVFLGGGGLCGNDPGCINHLDAEIYSPPYLFNSNGTPATRPTISAPEVSNYNSTISVTGSSGISEFALLRASSATHSTNNEQRRIPLAFSASGTSYSVNIPQRELLPPGYYMLFGLNQAGVPSIAEHIKIGSPINPGPSPNLVLDLKFDEGLGINALDSSNFANHATIIERDNNQNPIPVTKSYWSANGLFGSALEMDGFQDQSNSIVEVPYSSSIDDMKDGMTVMAWVNRDEIANNVSILTNHYPKFFFGFHNSLYKLEFTTTGGSANCYAGYSPAQKWVHIAGTYDGEQAKLYANGVEICSVETTGDITTQTTGQYISSFTTSGFYNGSTDPGNSGITDEIDGRIDDLKVFNKAFGNSEIEAYYNLGVQTQNPAVVACAPNAIVPQYRIGTSGSWITSTTIPAGMGADVYIRANVAAQEDYFVTLPAAAADTYSSATDFSNNGYRIGNSFGIDFSDQGQYVLTGASGCTTVITLVPEAACADIFPEYRVNGVWSSGFDVLTLNEGDDLVLSILPNNTSFSVVTPDGTDKIGDYDIGAVNTGHAGIYTFSTASGCVKTLQLIVNDGTGCTLTPEHTVNGTIGTGNVTVDEGDTVVLGVVETGTVYTVTAPDGSVLSGSPSSGFDLGQIALADAGIYTFNAEGVQGLPVQGVTAIFADSQETSGEDGQMGNAVDGNPNTFWHTRWEAANDPQPHEIHLDLGTATSVGAMTYLPRQDGDINGTIAGYEVYVSNSTTSWGTVVATGTWFNDTSLKTINFPPKQGRYVRFRSLSEVGGGPWASAAEITVFQSGSGSGCTAQLTIDVVPVTGCTLTPTHTVNGTTGSGNLTVDEGDTVVLGITETGTDYTVMAPDGSPVTGSPAAGFNLGAITPVQAGVYTFSSGGGGTGAVLQGITAIFADSQETSGEDGKMSNALDGNPNTFWHTRWDVADDPQPHEIHLDLGTSTAVGGFTYLPRQDVDINGTVAGYEIYVSNSTTNWGTAVATGTWPNSKTLKTVNFPEKQGRYVRFRSTSEVGGNPWTCAAEIQVVGAGSGSGCAAQLTIDVVPDTTGCTLTPTHTVNGTTGSGNVTVDEGDTVVLGITETGTDYTVTAPDGSPVIGSPAAGFNLGAITPVQAGVYTFSSGNGGTGAVIQGVTAIFADSQETSGEDGQMSNALDGNPNTFWHTRWDVADDPQPHEIHLDLGAATDVGGFTYLPRQDSDTFGTVAGYEIYVSNSTTSWGTAVATGTWPNSKTLKTVNFPQKQGRYVRFRSTSEVGGNPWTCAAELQVIGAGSGSGCTAQLTIDVVPDPLNCGITPAHTVNGVSGTGNVSVNVGDAVVLDILESGINYTVTAPDGQPVSGSTATGFDLGAITSQQSGVYSFTTGGSGPSGPVQGVTAIFTDSQETSGEDGKMSNALDGNPNTFWHTRWDVADDPQPHEIHLDLGSTTSVTGFTYLPRQDVDINGTVAGYEIYVSNSTTTWGTAVATGTWPNNKTLKTVNFPQKQGRYLRFRSTSEVAGNPWTCAAELQVIGSEVVVECTEQLTITVNGNAGLKSSLGTNGRKNDIQIFPNPTRSEFSVDVADLMNVPLTVHVFNGQGQEVLSYKLDKDHHEVHKIDISDLAAGVYRIILAEPNGRPYAKSVILEK